MVAQAVVAEVQLLLREEPEQPIRDTVVALLTQAKAVAVVVLMQQV